jgi:beta-glucosidase
VLDDAIRQRHQSHLATENAKLPPRQGIEAFLPARLAPEPALDAAAVAASAREAAAAVLTLRRTSGEFVDRPPQDFYLEPAEKALVAAVSRAFRAAGKPIIVVLNVGGPIEVASWRDQADALLVAWQPGQEAGHALSDVLTGAVNPAGKLPMTFPKDWKDVPAAQGFPGKVLEPGDSDRPPPFGGAKAAEVEYADGIEVGYRSLRQRPVAPAYAFGHGLSYTSFAYGALQVAPSGSAPSGWTVTLAVTNSGKVAGAEVVQLYVSAPREGLPKPLLELRRFAKTRRLAPGESQTLSFELGPRELASFDEKAGAWVVAAGTYTLQAGASVADLRRSAPLEVSQAANVPLE